MATALKTDNVTSFDLGKYNGTLTVTSTKTGEHRTFRIRTQKPGEWNEGAVLASLLIGPDNTSDYWSFAYVNRPADRPAFCYAWKPKRGPLDHNTAITYAKMLGNLDNLIQAGKITVLASIRCRVCNRKLTTPESIQSGIGPICGGRVVEAV